MFVRLFIVICQITKIWISQKPTVKQFLILTKKALTWKSAIFIVFPMNITFFGPFTTFSCMLLLLYYFTEHDYRYTVLPPSANKRNATFTLARKVRVFCCSRQNSMYDIHQYIWKLVICNSTAPLIIIYYYILKWDIELLVEDQVQLKFALCGCIILFQWCVVTQPWRERCCLCFI